MGGKVHGLNTVWRTRPRDRVGSGGKTTEGYTAFVGAKRPRTGETEVLKTRIDKGGWSQDKGLDQLGRQPKR